MNFRSLLSRRLWLAGGIIAILGLTGLNVYTIYQLRNESAEAVRQSKILQVNEFADRVRHRFIHPFHAVGGLNMKKVEQTFNQKGGFTDKMTTAIYKASKDSIYKNIYYIPAGSNVCYENDDILVFDKAQKHFIPTDNYRSVVCDGLGMARTRMKALIESYRFNNKILFDTHRSMSIALVNSKEQAVVGFLVMPVDQSYLINKYLQPELVEVFGGEKNTGITVWLRYWTKQVMLANSDPQKQYDRDLVQYVHQFPDFFDDWRLYVAMNDSLLAASKSSSFIFNLVVLGVAFILLIGALIFMFVTAQRERELADRQSGFLANVTHELKTPLAVMQAAGENLSDGRIHNKQRLKKYGSHIYSEALRLRSMIDKLLDVAKADAGKSFIKPEPRSVDLLLKKYIYEHSQYIEEEGFSIKISIEKNMPQALLDEHSFHTILNNLIGNAMKYSFGDKFLKISLSYSEKNIILEVEDRGTGMSDKTVKHIFDKFYRAEDTLTAQTKGNGLGLSIVKNLVELNKGTIDVKTEKGNGSIFTVTFPAIIETKKEETYEYEIAVS